MKADASLILAAERELCRRSLAEFAKQAWPVLEPATPLKWGWALDCMCEHLEAVSRGELKRLLMNVPPGSMKSLLTGVLWPAWEWGPGARPELRYLGTAHKQDLAVRDNMKCRRLIQSTWYQERWPLALVGDQNAKCLATGTRVSMADGSLKNIEDVRAGDKILSFDFETREIITDEVVHQWSNGVKPVRRMTLSDGSYVTATHNHRFYGWDDWIWTSDVSEGDAYCVMGKAPEQFNDLELDDVFLVALWLAEGAKSASCYTFSGKDDKIISRVRRIAFDRGWKVTPYGDCTYTVTNAVRGMPGSPMSVLKEYIGSVKTYGSRSKIEKQFIDAIRVPKKIMSGSLSAVREFLGTYIATDGCVINGKNHGVSITSVSSGLIFDIQHLVKRLGIRSRVASHIPVNTSTGKMGMRAYVLNIMSRDDILRLRGVNVFGKQEKLAALLSWASGNFRHDSTRSATIPPNAHSPMRWMTSKRAIRDFSHDEDFIKKVTGDVSWRRVTSVEDLPDTETWHIETKSTGMFFANGVLSHNTKFENDTTGFREAMAFTSMTGSRGDRVILDDPHSVDDANSVVKLQADIMTFREALPSRVNNDESAIVIIMQRLNEKDVSATALELGYDHVCIPMRYEDGRSKWIVGKGDPRTTEGELMFPERFPPEQVEELERTLGSYATAGQLQQRPAPRDGGLFKLGWFKTCAVLPNDLTSTIRFWDLAATAKHGSSDPDWTAGVLMSRRKSGGFVIHGCRRFRGTPMEVETAIMQQASLDGKDVIVGLPQDPGQAGKAQADQFVRKLAGYRVKVVRPTGDKATRAMPLAAQAEAGNVEILLTGDPALDSWVQPFLDEMCMFPAGGHDDQVDAASDAFNELALRRPGYNIHGIIGK